MNKVAVLNINFKKKDILFRIRPIFIGIDHINLRSRTSMLAQVFHKFLGKEHPVKNWLISTLDKVIYFKGTIFQRSTRPLFTSQNRVEIR
jgi:hypothetical protein